jgi:hypothetical protein
MPPAQLLQQAYAQSDEYLEALEVPKQVVTLAARRGLCDLNALDQLLTVI